MANRDPEPESQHQQIPEDFLERQKAQEAERILTLASTPLSAGSFFNQQEADAEKASGIQSDQAMTDLVHDLDKKKGDKGGKK